MQTPIPRFLKLEILICQYGTGRCINIVEDLFIHFAVSYRILTDFFIVTGNENAVIG